MHGYRKDSAGPAAEGWQSWQEIFGCAPSSTLRAEKDRDREGACPDRGQSIPYGVLMICLFRINMSGGLLEVSYDCPSDSSGLHPRLLLDALAAALPSYDVSLAQPQRVRCSTMWLT